MQRYNHKTLQLLLIRIVSLQKNNMKKLNIVLVLIFCGLLFGCSDGEEIIDEPLNFGNLITTSGLNFVRDYWPLVHIPLMAFLAQIN